MTKRGMKVSRNEAFVDLETASRDGVQNYLDQVVVELLTQPPLVDKVKVVDLGYLADAVRSVYRTLASYEVTSEVRVQVASAWFWHIMAAFPDSGNIAGGHVYRSWTVLSLTNDEYQLALQEVVEDSKSDPGELTEESKIALEWMRTAIRLRCKYC